MNIDKIDRICIVGLARSGIALAELLLKLKKKPMITDSKESNTFPAGLLNRLKSQGVCLDLGAHSEDFIKQAGLVIFSPGVDQINSPVGKLCAKLGISVVGEVEFCSWFTKAKIVAITGTNGKSTTTFLTYRILKEKLGGVYLGGNIGIPFSTFVLRAKPGDVVVLETSSFQLETIVSFKPYVAAITNIEPDHMDRYGDFKDYFEAKMNIFKNQSKDDWAVLNKNSEFLEAIKKRTSARIETFGFEMENENLSCVYRIGSIFGVDENACRKLFSSFPGLPHRAQLVRKIDEVSFVNDSKATNPASTVWALKNIKAPIVLIAGGKDKGLDYRLIVPYMKNVKKLNLFGAAAKKIESELGRDVPTELFGSLEDVIHGSKRDANPGDCVLLSPMCSSYDMFTSYIERGRKFAEIVNRL